MISPPAPEQCLSALTRAGFSGPRAEAWLERVRACRLPGSPEHADKLDRDAARVGEACTAGWNLLEELPLKSRRSAAERAAGEAVLNVMADLCWRFLGSYRRAVYAALARGVPCRLETLARRAGERFTGILPSAEDIAGEARKLQKDKDGMEIFQGLLFAQLFADPEAGTEIVHAMLQPTQAARDRLEDFRRTGVVDLGAARVEARGEAGWIHFHNPRFLNAEDDTTLEAQEAAVDLVLLHPDLRMGVLRGDTVDHPSHRGRRIFSAGINLTRIYQGQQSYLFYLVRDLGWVNKIYRGLSLSRPCADEPEHSHEIPWLAVVDRFAIGGGCQLLLVVDYVIAEAGAYFNLPARKEGIIPGCANLRLPRFMGERMARQAIMFDKTFHVDEPDARVLVNETAPREELDERVEQVIANALGSGMVSAGANRRALRVQAEPVDVLRRYMATYAFEQGFCHLSEQLVENLERYWNAKNRSL
ncbi:MAG TPA: enoyl-CoA hydratase/isomerase family protein [Arenicellales bacterium]|nr:enoyl-CoA hydratase/isomerase family protein [Arenicellales bacterium]